MKMQRHMCLGLFLVCLVARPGQAQVTHWLVTEWGSVYRNFERVADKKFKEPSQIAGTADHYWVATRDGVIWRDGQVLDDKTFREGNVVDLEAKGDDWYVLMLSGALYKNGQAQLPAGRIERPVAMSLIGEDIWILNDAGMIYKNGAQVGETWMFNGRYPEHFAVSGETCWFSVSQGTTGGNLIYKGAAQAHPEGFIVRALGAVGDDFYIFTGKSLFKNFERVARFEADTNTPTKLDNVMDFDFVLP